MVYEILSQTELDRLAAYETDKYQLRPCFLEFLNDDDSVEMTMEGVASCGMENRMNYGKARLT